MLFDEDTNRRIAERLFAHLDGNTTDMADAPMPYDPAIYRDPEVAARELDVVFARFPLFAAHSSQIPEPHDFTTVRLSRSEILLVRQDDGSVRGFLNTCRHRGAQLTLEEAGNCRRFTCRYHGWSYASDGSLSNISYAASVGDVDRDAWGLVELPVQEYEGLIFAVETPGETIDLAGYLGHGVAGILRQLAIAGYHQERRREIQVDMNWKVAQDGFLDSYHLKFLHPKTVGPFFYPISAYDQMGRHARWVTARTAIDEIRDRPPGEVSLDRYVIQGVFMFPNSTLVAQPDHFEIWTFLPDAVDPTRSRAVIRFLTPEPSVTEEDQAMWDKNYRILMSAVENEDLPVGESIQSTAAAPGAGELVLGRNEMANQHFHREMRIALELAAAAG